MISCVVHEDPTKADTLFQKTSMSGILSSLAFSYIFFNNSSIRLKKLTRATMEYYANNRNFSPNLAIIFLLLLAGVLYLGVTSVSMQNPLQFLRQTPNYCTSPLRTIKFPIDELELALEKASNPNKTVIIAVVNKAYVDQTVKSETTMFDLFLESLWLGEGTRPLLDNLLVVAADQTAYDRCLFKKLHCYKLETEGVDFGGEKIYMSKDFVKMMWRRTLFLLDVLKHGYNFIFTDVDVMWLRNPFSRLSTNETIDLQISTDWFNGKEEDENNLINTGFYFSRSNNKTISLFESWFALKDNSTGKKEQDVLSDLLRQGKLRELNITARFLDTTYFSGFCTESKDIRAVSTVHANCCRSISAKVADLKGVLRDWKKFKAVSEAYAKKNMSRRVPFRWSGHFGCWNSWNTTVKIG